MMISTRAVSNPADGRGSGWWERRGVAVTTSRPPAMCATSVPPWNGLLAVVCALRAPRAERTVPLKEISTPLSCSAGDAAASAASSTLRGPSGAGLSAGCWAPVRTTVVTERCTGSSRNAVSSKASVPWVTTTPSVSRSSSASWTASAIRRRSPGVSR
jgi:hypothetical protein